MIRWKRVTQVVTRTVKKVTRVVRAKFRAEVTQVVTETVTQVVTAPPLIPLPEMTALRYRHQAGGPPAALPPGARCLNRPSPYLQASLQLPRTTSRLGRMEPAACVGRRCRTTILCRHVEGMVIMNVAAFTVSLIDHGLAELAERTEAMPMDQLQAELEDLLAGGRSAAGDLVVAILAREITRRDQESRDG